MKFHCVSSELLPFSFPLIHVKTAGPCRLEYIGWWGGGVRNGCYFSARCVITRAHSPPAQARPQQKGTETPAAVHEAHASTISLFVLFVCTVFFRSLV